MILGEVLLILELIPMILAQSLSFIFGAFGLTFM